MTHLAVFRYFVLCMCWHYNLHSPPSHLLPEIIYLVIYKRFIMYIQFDIQYIRCNFFKEQFDTIGIKQDYIQLALNMSRIFVSRNKLKFIATLAKLLETDLLA